MSDTGYMLDASALLALMLGERGNDVVRSALPSAAISAVNLAEVIAKLQERGIPDDVVAESLIELDLAVIAFDQHHALHAGRLRAVSKQTGLSLGDRACLAVAAATGRIALTTDRAWTKVEVGVAVEIAR